MVAMLWSDPGCRWIPIERGDDLRFRAGLDDEPAHQRWTRRSTSRARTASQVAPCESPADDAFGASLDLGYPCGRRIGVGALVETGQERGGDLRALFGGQRHRVVGSLRAVFVTR